MRKRIMQTTAEQGDDGTNGPIAKGWGKDTRRSIEKMVRNGYDHDEMNAIAACHNNCMMK
jgi:hypothetical protein